MVPTTPALHQNAGRQDKGKVITKVAEHIAQLVPHPEGAQFVLVLHNKTVLS